MGNTAKFVSVPSIDVTEKNVAALGPVVCGAIIGADYIAIDCVSFFWKKILDLFIFFKTKIDSTYFVFFNLSGTLRTRKPKKTKRE